MASSFLRFIDDTQRHSHTTTLSRTPLNEWSARRRDLYLTTHNTHNRQTSMPPAGFEPTISAGERPQTYALDRTATGTGKQNRYELPNFIKNSKYVQGNPCGGQLRTDMTRQVFAFRFADVSLNCDLPTDCICSLGMISTVNSDCYIINFNDTDSGGCDLGNELSDM